MTDTAVPADVRVHLELERSDRCEQVFRRRSAATRARKEQVALEERPALWHIGEHHGFDVRRPR